MPEGESTPASTGRGLRSRRWFIGVAAGLAGGGLIYGASRSAFRLWMRSTVPEDAPSIAFSLDDTWLNRLGITDTTYQQAITRSGGRLARVTPSDIRPGEARKLLAQLKVSGLLLTGGGDVDPRLYGGDEDEATLVDRARDDFEIELIRSAHDEGLPILGICRGCQILNVAFGGTLRNLRHDDALRDAHFSFTGHDVEIHSPSRLRTILGVDRVDGALSFHRQAVDRLGDKVRAAAIGPGKLVEAIEVGDTESDWIIGVQWHPEFEPTNRLHDRLFDAFVARSDETTIPT